MPILTIDRPAGFRLEAAADFYRDFIPGSGMAAAAVDELTLAFRLDQTFEAVAVALREEGETVVAEYQGTAEEAVLRRQLERILGLEASGDAWRAVGRRDPVVGRLQREFPGFFTACKASPYDAAIWAVISPRLGGKQAARLKMDLARRHGTAVAVRGREHHVFPAPAALLAIAQFPGLSDEKLRRCQGVAAAALAGRLDAQRLRARDEAAALSELQSLRGIGPWSAGHILYRGAGPIDALPASEPRVLHGVAHAYGIAPPSLEEYRQIAERWRPFRMWVCVLLMRHLGRSDAWNARGLARERAAAGRSWQQRLSP
jgi:DNA-3-methyladenine glycosylase II